VALMMGFFVVLLAMNMKPSPSGSVGVPGESDGTGTMGAMSDANNPEMLDLAIAIREAFNNPISETDPRDAVLAARKREKEGKGQAREHSPDGRHDRVEVVRPTEYSGLGGVVSFEEGSAAMTPEGRAQADRIAQRLRGMRVHIDLRGHCSSKEAVGRPDHGASLTFERTLAVAQHLVESGLPWDQLSLIAESANARLTEHPYDDQARRVQQRVEVIATSDDVGG
jgi:outer membrane protein OmpA-like peptidoglycan-associated protein